MLQVLALFLKSQVTAAGRDCTLLMCNQGKLFTTFWFNLYVQPSYDVISHDGYFVGEEALHTYLYTFFKLACRQPEPVAQEWCPL